MFWVEIKVNVAICLRKFKIRDFYLLGSYPLVGVKGFRCSEKKMFWSWVTPLVGRHVVNEPKVGCHVITGLEIS